MGIVIFQKMIYRVDLQANKNMLYIFGDNLDRRGMGGQAFEMRGEPNSFGIATKRSISHSYPDDYFFDSQPDTMEIIRNEFDRLQHHWIHSKYEGMVIPFDGLGTGLSRLPETAPSALAYINDRLQTLSLDVKSWSLARNNHDELLAFGDILKGDYHED